MYKDKQVRRTGRIVATIEARMSSSRLPGKVLLPLAGKPSLERLVERARRSKHIDEVVVATTVSDKDQAVVDWAQKAGVAVFRGSEEDVLLRVLEAARAYRGDVIVELTGDCPLIDPGMIDELIEFYRNSDCDYVSNILIRSFPRGWDTQVFSTELLAEVDRSTQDPADRENVSLYIYEKLGRFKLGCITAPPELYGPDIRICTDQRDDYEVIAAIYDALYHKDPAFSAKDIMRFLKDHPEIATKNSHIQQKKVRV